MKLMNNILKSENPGLTGRNYVYPICWHDELGRAKYTKITRVKNLFFTDTKTVMSLRGLRSLTNREF